ncbi:hypothetical protein [Bdellovibrio sp. HCB2-146]|uniref:hypothetical protein n=1 Tax=Bdellovibrio sp. HCB2-146 TaxID=3394362 RepID=UPI0039BC8627
MVPLTPTFWKVEYDGGGKVLFNFDGSGDLLIQPQTPNRSDETFAALVLLKPSMQFPLKNYVVSIDVTTTRQLRADKPNEWEVFWFFGNYRAKTPHAKEANYFLLKPQAGAELGRAFEQVGQQFLKTDNTKTLILNKRQRFTYVKNGAHFRVYRGNQLVLDYNEKETASEGLYDHAGALGLYAEDAQVRVHSFSYRAL